MLRTTFQPVAARSACFASNTGGAGAVAGIHIGFYYSLTNNFYLNVAGKVAKGANGWLPGMAANVTQSEFERIAMSQLTELWTNYGNFRCVLVASLFDICPTLMLHNLLTQSTHAKKRNLAGWRLSDHNAAPDEEATAHRTATCCRFQWPGFLRTRSESPLAIGDTVDRNGIGSTECAGHLVNSRADQRLLWDRFVRSGLSAAIDQPAVQLLL